MQNLLLFLYRFRTFGLFLLLEVICAWLIISYNNRPNAAFLNSSNVLVAGVNALSSNTSNYFLLKEINAQLIKENLYLREQLANQVLANRKSDTSETKYEFFKATVLNNTYRRAMNYLTLDVGLKDSIYSGMAVISGEGVVGQVKSVSNHYSTVTSLLHRNLLVSTSIQRTNTLCTVQWDGTDPQEISLKYVPRHVPITIGDTIVTSGFNSIFPPEMMIGRIKSFELADNDVFYQAKVELAVDFSSLEYVYVIRNNQKPEQDSLEQVTLLDQ